MRSRAALAALALLLGCSSGPEQPGARLVELELAVERLALRVDALAAQDLAARVQGLEAALALPTPEEDALARLSELEAKLLDLEHEIEGLARAVEAARQGRRLARARGEGEASGPSDAPTLIPQPGAGARLPEAGAPVEVLSIGSGTSLLVRGDGGLVRVELLGVEAPYPAEHYAERPILRERHAGALGATAVATDAAFEASLAHLRELVAGGTVSLAYGATPGHRPRGGIVAAYVRVVPEEGDPVEVNQAMVRDGYGLATPGHERYAEFAALEEAAREAGRGLWAKAE